MAVSSNIGCMNHSSHARLLDASRKGIQSLCQRGLKPAERFSWAELIRSTRTLRTYRRIRSLNITKYSLISQNGEQSLVQTICNFPCSSCQISALWHKLAPGTMIRILVEAFDATLCSAGIKDRDAIPRDQISRVPQYSGWTTGSGETNQFHQLFRVESGQISHFWTSRTLSSLHSCMTHYGFAMPRTRSYTSWSHASPSIQQTSPPRVYRRSHTTLSISTSWYFQRRLIWP